MFAIPFSRVAVLFSVDDVIDLAFGTAVEPAREDELIVGFTKLFDGIAGSASSYSFPIFPTFRRNFIGLPDEVLNTNYNYYFERDPWVQKGFEFGAANPSWYFEEATLVGSRQLTAHDMRTSEYINEFGRRYGLDDHLTARIPVGTNKAFMLSVNRPYRRGFDDQDVATLEHLMSHLRRAFRVQQTLLDAGWTTGPMSLWEESPVAVMGIKEKMLAFANRRARELFRAGSVVSDYGKRLAFKDTTVQSALDKLQSPPKFERQSSECGVFLVDTSDDGSWLVQIVALAPKALQIFNRTDWDAPTVLVFVSPRSVGAALKQGTISGFVGLSDSEKGILTGLAGGLSIQQVADRSGRSEATVRWHVKSLMKKTQTRSLADLVRIGALLLPLV